MGSVVVSRGTVGHQPGDASCSAGVGMCRGWGSTEGRGAPVTTLLTRPRLPLAEAGLGAAGAGREEAELHPTAVPLPAGGACLPTLHPGALRALPGPLPLPAPEENEGESLSDPSTPPPKVSQEWPRRAPVPVPLPPSHEQELQCCGAAPKAPRLPTAAPAGAELGRSRACGVLGWSPAGPNPSACTSRPAPAPQQPPCRLSLVPRGRVSRGASPSGQRGPGGPDPQAAEATGPAALPHHPGAGKSVCSWGGVAWVPGRSLRGAVWLRGALTPLLSPSPGLPWAHQPGALPQHLSQRAVAGIR